MCPRMKIWHFALPMALLFLVSLPTTGFAQQQRYSRRTNLPCVYINTLDGTAITSKTEYKYATLRYVDEQDSLTVYDSIQIRGRGNSTWNLSKKPYRIKFAQKEKFLGKGYAKARNWTLLANAADKTLIRNAITSAMGEFAGLKFNPAYKFVDLVLNNTYVGNYQISDQVDVRPHRVNITEQDYPLADSSNISGGYLLEVDGFKDGNYFTSSTYSLPIRIHYPDDDEIDATQNSFIKNYINAFETTLASSSFADSLEGYRPLVDSTSLVNWFLCTEITANIDGYYSAYFYKEQDDPKLYFGPLWDYDIAYDNDSRITPTTSLLMTDSGYGATKYWLNRMWEDPWFTHLVNRRYAELLEDGLVEYLETTIDSLVDLMAESRTENYNKWSINTRTYHEVVLYDSYEDYIDYVKNFISSHTAYLTTAFANKQIDFPEEETELMSDFEPGDYFYHIYNYGTNKPICADADGMVVQTTYAADSLNQQWEVRAAEDYFLIINRQSGLALCDPTEGEATATTNVGKYLATATIDLTDESQQWTIYPQQTDGTYNLINRHTQHVANLSSGNTADGTHLLSYTNDSRNSTSKNRLWLFEECADLVDGIETLQVAAPDSYALAYNQETHWLHFGADNPSDLDFPVSIYDIRGERIASFRASDGYSFHGKPAGVYIVNWTVGGRTISRKLIVSHQ